MISWLLEKLKTGAFSTGLVAILYLSGCTIQQGSERISVVFVPPFSTYVKQEHFKTEECKEIEGVEEAMAFNFFGNRTIEIKRYDENKKYLGKEIITAKNRYGAYEISMKKYDTNDRLIEETEEFPVEIDFGRGF